MWVRVAAWCPPVQDHPVTITGQETEVTSGKSVSSVTSGKRVQLSSVVLALPKAFSVLRVLIVCSLLLPKASSVLRVLVP